MAASPARRESARAALRDAVHARSAQAPRASRDATLRAVAQAAGVPLFPPAPSSVATVAAALKAAGYKSAPLYLSQWKVEARRRGYALCPATRQAFADAARATSRDTHPTQRSRALRPEDAARVRDPVVRDSLLVCCWWMLREAEARALSRKDIALDLRRRTASLRLATSKAGPEGRGATRTLQCTCKAHEDAKWRTLCPFHACARLLSASRERRCEGAMPGPSGARWKKGHLARLVRQWVRATALGGEATSRWGGHSCRRGGAQFFHRMGVPLSATKHMGRWGSDAIYRYLEELEVDTEGVAPSAIRELIRQHGSEPGRRGARNYGRAAPL